MTAPQLAAEDLGAGYFADPYSAHARLRAQGPVTSVILPGSTGPAWLITGYAEARAALTDPLLRKSMPGWAPEPGSVFSVLEQHMLNSDPPDHGRLRRLVNKVFTARHVERLRPRIEAITTGLLDDIGARSEVDLLASFAFPLPITVICELLGVPTDARDDFREWSATVVSNTAAEDLMYAHATAMVGFFRAQLAAKRRQPTDDLLSALIAVRDSGDSLSEDELVSMAFLLLVAGHETTVNLIASGVLALLLNLGQFERLRADPGLIGGAVEELLRYVAPVSHTTFRCAAEPVDLGGVRIGRGDAVWVALSGANRDPARFGDPEGLDLGRDSSGHLAFGHGIHYCVGAPLARLEAQIAFAGLLARFGGMRLAVPPESLRWRPSTLIHSLESLPVRLAPSGLPGPFPVTEPGRGGRVGRGNWWYTGPMGRLTEIAPGVLVATSEFAVTTSTVVVGADGGCLLIDPAVTVADLAALAGELAGRGLRPTAAWSTHPHWDHILWSAALGDAPRYAAPAAVPVLVTLRDHMVEQLSQAAPGHDLELFGKLRALDGPVIPWDGPEARLIIHDGHAPGHGAVFLPDSGVLLAGDMCSDLEIPLLDIGTRDPLGDYRTGVERLASVAGVRQVVPGHGHVGDTAELRRRLGLDTVYLDAVSAGRPYQDPRLTEASPAWMRAMHDDQVRYFKP